MTGPGAGGPREPAVPMEPLRPNDPQHLGPYRLLGRLGAGGMGVAFLADRDGSWTVVKMFRSEVSEDAGFGPRMLRELEAMQRAAGPYTASVLEFDLESHPAWFAMDFIPGMTLARRIESQGPLRGSELRAFADELKVAIDSIHEAGLIHRDLKPSNIILSPEGPKLLDFGIAEVSDATQLTATGHVLGTIGWLAPEQVSGDPVLPETDLHAWGLCVLYAATAEQPFGNGAIPVMMNRVMTEIPSVPATIPDPLRSTIQRALLKDPAERSMSVERTREIVPQATTELTRASNESPKKSPQRSRLPRVVAIVVAGALVVGAGGVAWAMSRQVPAEATSREATSTEPAVTQAPQSAASSAPTKSTAQVSASEQAPSLGRSSSLTAVAKAESVKLKWDPVDGAEEYQVLQRNKKGEYVKIKTVKAAAKASGEPVVATINGLESDRDYTFAVVAVQGDTSGLRSRDVTVRPKSPDPIVVNPVPAPTTPTYPSDVGGGPGDTGTEPDPGPTLVLEGDPDELVLKPQ